MFQPSAMKVEVTFSETEVTARTPEERLMIAVLEDALVTFERGLTSRNPMVRRAFHEVDHWVRNRENDGLFSFESICSMLGLDTEYLRAGLAVVKRSARLHQKTNTIRKLRREHIADRRVGRGQIGS